MPTYAYHCGACDREFERAHRMSDPKPPCPKCGGEVKRLIAGPAGTIQSIKKGTVAYEKAMLRDKGIPYRG
ncbi:MAG TPA: zinc ribbon domain-containing protein [Polyangiaceae bacterium LLY-WYZ-14_1]|jgi:putative FmdB family regulatory protein|nr:zinc ribbon domain-containing protein [Polyangiaceae bacterium LLY-WYZ-14_1]